MPTSTSSVRKPAPRQLMTKRRESIAAFEQWQRNWSASVHGADPRRDANVSAPKRALTKHHVHHSASHHSR